MKRLSSPTAADLDRIQRMQVERDEALVGLALGILISAIGVLLIVVGLA